MSLKVYKILCLVFLVIVGIIRNKEKYLGEGLDIRREVIFGFCGFLRMFVDFMFFFKCFSGCEFCIVFFIVSIIVFFVGGFSFFSVRGCVYCRGKR